MEGERPAGGEELSEDNRPRIPASEILAKIEKGETVRYLGEGIIVVGDLDLRSLDLPTQHVKRTKGQENHGLK
ncbi:MAG TPA: hypothetical protein PLI05_11255 [Methanotrichaceae archaeon]|nr:hypothetical protein [Methanotrichaceae archaeon]HQF17629.1 hypothetical protein [Methanotrichaceae archaeon]HQI92217.1 hypothetical protein [Methanotrichaceae archaeon]